MYKINYSKLNQKGGNNDIITFIPDYPNNLAESRSNGTKLLLLLILMMIVI